MIYKSIDQVPVWIKSHKACIQVYKVTESFPRSEVYGLTSQLRRASSSVPANITEGFYRHTRKELLVFLYNARGSLGETVYFLLLAMELGYINKNEHRKLKEDYEEIGKQLNGWINSLRTT